MPDLHLPDTASQPAGYPAWGELPVGPLAQPKETCMHPFAYDHLASLHWEHRA